MKEDATQDKMIPGGKFDKEKKYWQEKLSGGLKPGGFPVDYTENGFDGNKRQKLRFRFPGEILTKLLSISNNSQYGIFIILVTGLNYLLFKYTGDEDIIIGVPVLKQKTYGAGSNKIMVLRNPVKPAMTFKDLLLQVKHTAAEANEHSDYYPFNEIIKLVNLSPRDGSSAHLSVMVGFKNIHGTGFFDNQKADTFFSFEMTEECLECEINYNSMLFSDKTIECLGRQLINYFAAITQNPVSKLSGIDIVSREEKQQILYQFNNTPANYPRSKTINRLFAEQVEKTPGRTAAVYEDNRLMYEELDRQSNRLARMIKQEYGVGEGDIVAFQVPRSPEMIIGIMGILKANAACLPIDPRYPGERIALLLKDSEAKFVLKEIDSEKLKKFSPAALENTGKPGSVAYIIYTSGSTGRPKGVMLHHRGIINHVYTKINELDVNGGDILCQNLNIGFVASIWQFFAPLFVGAELHIYPENVLVDPYRFFERVARDQTSVAEVVPSLLNAYLELLEAGKVKIHLPSLKVLALTGEKVTPSLVNKFHKKYRINLVNAYGQSECSDDTLHYKIPYNIGTKAVPIGKPANNTRVYVLSPEGRLQPPGIPGELHISGDGLAVGYLNNPDLTAEAFVPNPFEPGERMYRTGDLCRWLPDGNIEFSGRIDHQVKISGFRVELQEIENRLLTHDEIKEAVVTARGGEGNKYLCAYIVAHSAGSSARSPLANTGIFALSPPGLQLELREYLSAGLPDYMIPSHFIPVEKIPLTPSGKIDRQALPEPEKETAKSGDGVSGDEIEEKLAGLWSGILKMDAPKIDRNANFFELGGNSLRAVALVSKIHKELNVDISLTEIFDFPTIEGLAQFVKEAAKETYASIETVEEKEYYPLSSAQKRLYVMQQMDKKITVYNVVQAVVLQGIFEIEKLEEIFAALITRHESLRTSFETIGDEPVQRIHDKVEFEIEQHTPVCGPPSQEGIVKAFVRPFDLANAPLLRVGLIERGNREYILMVDIHHIISDGTSHHILIQEFETLDSGERLKPLRLQYKDFSEWQNRLFAAGKINIQEEYWLSKFAGEIPVLNLPADFTRSSNPGFEGGNVTFVIGKEETKALNSLALEEEATIFILLVSVFNVLLGKLSSREDIVVGTMAAGRRHADLENIIGMFVNSLVLRNYPGRAKTFQEFLREVKKNTLEAFENQDYPFERFVDKILQHRDAKHNPLFDVVFQIQNMEFQPGIDREAKTKQPEVKFSPYELDYRVSHFDLIFDGAEMGDTLFFTVFYKINLFKKKTIESFIKYFREIIGYVLENKKIKLEDIRIAHDLGVAKANISTMEFGF